MRRIIGLFSLSGATLMLPVIASAANLLDTLVFINKFLNGIIGIIITIAIIVFFWGLVRYITNVGEEKHNGLILMFYGLIAIFVMVSIWGIIHLLQTTFQVGGNNSVIIPAMVPSGSTIR